MNQGQGNMHFNSFSPAHMSQQNMQPQQGMMQQMPQHSPMGQQQIPQQLPQQMPQQMAQQIPQQMMQQSQPQLMQQQLMAQQQQMMAQQQMPQQQQMLQQQQMNHQMNQQMNQQMPQHQMSQQQMNPQLAQQQMPQQQMNAQQQMAQQQMPMQQQMMAQQQPIFQHPQQHSPAPQQVMQQQQQFLQQQQQHQMQQQQQPQQQAQKDFNPASLCRIGQETVQELVSRVQECLQLLKNLQPPNGTAQSTSMALDKKNKLDDQLKTVKVLFKRLRIVYNKCNENSQELDSYPLDTMVPTQSNLVDWKYSEKKKSDQYLAALEERKELFDQILVKNRHLQDIMEYMRSIIWEINTMLMMRRP